MIALAAVGDATDPATWSGIPWHCLEAGAALGVLGRGLALDTTASAWRRRRVAWNLSQLATGRKRGGYQYSGAFLDRLFGQDPPRPGETVVNMFQLYPERLFARHDGALWFYIDQTLSQLFEDYGVGARIDPRVAADALRRERAQYHAAAGVIGQSAFAANDVVARYGVPPERVHVALAGANISRTALAAFEARGRPSRTGPLRLVFVGKDWQRKGLDRLIKGLAAARAAGAEATLLTIGVDPATLPERLRADGVEFAGFVDKRREPDRFVDLVAGCDVGCLLSRAEAGGISLREFHRLGLVTIAPAVGGAPEYVLPGASHLVGPDADAAAIGALVHRLATEPGLLEAERATAWAARRAASWDAAVTALGVILTGSER